jgi:ferredoxin-thioredoxin reductase catalytic subunit
MHEEDEAYTANEARLRAIAESEGCGLNPDAERVQKVVGLMTRNFKEYGRYFCPCKQSHPLDPSKGTLCPCPEMGQEMAEAGHCFCRLFYRPAKD